MKQIIPCNVEMYAVYAEENGETKSRIIAFGLDEEGYIRPLSFAADLGADYADEPCNFLRYELEEQNQMEQLKRIAGALEDINCTLISMGGDIEALSECVDMNSFGIHFLRVDTGA